MSVNTSTPIKHILITGTSRGLGLELVRQYLENETNIHIHATARNIDNAKQLQELAQKYSNLSLIEMDVSSESSIQSSLKSLPPISLLINNAGINSSGPDIHSQESFVFEDVYRTNSIGPAIVINTLLSSLKEAVKLNLKPIVINISSTMGSITQMANNGWTIVLPYRMSKAALNMLTAYYAVLHKDITFISVCPGWVATDMGKTGGSPPLTPEYAVQALRKIIDNITPEQSGTFLDRDGKIEW